MADLETPRMSTTVYCGGEEIGVELPVTQLVRFEAWLTGLAGADFDVRSFDDEGKSLEPPLPSISPEAAQQLLVPIRQALGLSG